MADVPVQAKKKSGGWKNILVILIVIGIAIGGYHLISGTESEKSTKKASTNRTSENSTEADSNTTYYDNGNIAKVLEHDTNGTIRKVTYYREDGTIESSWENNESGAMTKHESYDESGKLESYNTAEYDENGNEIKSTFYDKNDKITQTNTMEYDENGNRNMIRIIIRLKIRSMTNQEMFWNIAFMKKLKMVNFLTIQHMMHKETLKNMENMKI